MHLTTTVNALLFVLCTAHAFDSEQYNFEIETRVGDNSVVLSSIISNFLIKYFGGERIFVSLILSSSRKEQYYFEEDFFNDLFDDPVLKEFAYNVLDKLDETIHTQRNAFNLIIVDDCQTLP